jgi:IS30 family transposase
MMATPAKKRKALSVDEKFAIITRIKNGEANVEVAKSLGLSHSTVSTIWKDRQKFEDAFKSNVQNKKKLRCSHYDDIDKSLLGWFKEKRKQGIPISGPILQAKAKDFGTSGNGKF